MGKRSNANGEFRLTGVLPGRYAIFARPSTGSDFYSDPTICEIGDADIQGIEVRVHRGLSISGVVVIEGTNDPAVLTRLSQVQISAYNRNPNPDQLNVPGAYPIKVNADGSFRITGLQPGKLQISMIPYPAMRGFMMSRVELNGVLIREGIDVNTGESVTGVRVVLVYGTLSMRGEVKVTGGILTPETRLYICGQQVGQTPGSRTKGGEVDARGQFLLENLSPGEYELRVSLGFYANSERPDPQLMRVFSAIRERVNLSGSNQQPVTLTINLKQE